MYGTDWQRSFRRTFLQGGCPATITIIALSVVLWFLLTVTHNSALLSLFAFDPFSWPVPYIWTVVTWPFVVDANPVFVLFAAMWAYSIGGSLERSWGTRNFTAFWCATNALTAVTLWLGAALMHAHILLAGLWVGLAPVTVAWCLQNRRETVMFSFVLPIPAIWLAWLTAVLVWYEVGPPFLGLFALSGCAAAYWYVVKGRSVSSGFGGQSAKYRVVRPDLGPGRESVKGGFSVARFLRDRREQRRLEDLFRRSGFDTDDKTQR